MRSQPTSCATLKTTTAVDYSCKGADKAIRYPPALHHIPLYSPLYGSVYREGLVTCCLSLSPQVVMMGTGHDEKPANFLRNAENNNKGRVASCAPNPEP